MIRLVRGALYEYTEASARLALTFEFNPEYITRSRSVSLTFGSAPGATGGFGFRSPADTPRVAQGVAVEPEGLSLEILLDATDRMNEGDPLAGSRGVQPEIDVLRAMVEPKRQGPDGVQRLTGLGQGGGRAFERFEYPSVLLLVWGEHVLPVFLKSVEVKEVAHFPTLVPYRANVTISMQVIESDNPFFNAARQRQAASALQQSAVAVAGAPGGHLSGVI